MQWPARSQASRRSSHGLVDRHDAISGGARDHLSRSRWPLDGDAIDPLALAEPEVWAPVVLAGESGPAVDDATLHEVAGLDRHLGADRAAVAARADELELDPVVGRIGLVAIEDGRLVLIGDDDIHRAAVGEVGHGHGASVVQVVHADAVRHVDPAGDSAIEVHARALVARQTRVAERGPRAG